LGSAVFDFDFVCMFFAVTAWISQLYRKQAVNEALYSEEFVIHYLATLTLIPPFGFSLIYCIIVPIIEKLAGCSERKAERRTRALRYFRARAQESDSESEASSDESVAGGGDGAAPGAATPGQGPGESGRIVAEDMQAATPARDPCEKGIPLALSAAIVVALEIFESLIPVAGCIHLVDHKMFVTGLIVKFKFWQIVLFLLESAISMKGCCRRVDTVAPCLKEAVELLVHANRMARDVFVSFFIGLTLLPWILFTAVNDFCCPNLSLHQLLIYRERPPKAAKNQRDDFGGSDSETDVGSPSGSEGESLVDTSMAPPTGTMGPPPGGSVTMLRGAGAGTGARQIFIGTQ